MLKCIVAIFAHNIYTRIDPNILGNVNFGFNIKTEENEKLRNIIKYVNFVICAFCLFYTSGMESLVDKIRRKIYTYFFIDINGDYKSSIFVAGTGRSGTTFVANTINYNNEYRLIFEPFLPYKVKICRNFRYRQYLRPENKDKVFIEPAKAILSGRFRNSLIDSQNKKCICKKRLIKDIRANHLLKWIHSNFPGVPIILLLRHPCAVAVSKLKLNWNTHIELFLAQEEIMEDFLMPFRNQIQTAYSLFEKHIFLWCIENYVPLKQFKKGEIHIAFYENFCMKPMEEIRRLFCFLGKDFDKKIFVSLRKPSSSTRKDSAIEIGDSLINSWKKNISYDQKQRAIEILNLFGLDRIYSHDSMPKIDNVHEIMAKN